MALVAVGVVDYYFEVIGLLDVFYGAWDEGVIKIGGAGEGLDFADEDAAYIDLH